MVISYFVIELNGLMNAACHELYDFPELKIANCQLSLFFDYWSNLKYSFALL